MAKIETVNFSAHAEIKNVIGQDLINDDNIAVIELVKNSLDANAQKINVAFHAIDDSSTNASATTILLSDNGVGMSRKDVVEKWLNIAYSEKRTTKSAGRWLAGNKGVGRFACDRLGRLLDLYSRKEGSRILHLRVDWTQFENQLSFDADISSIALSLAELTDLEYEKKTGSKPFLNGTVLSITELRSEWDEENLLSLRRNLERFVDPRASFESEKVIIELSATTFLSRDQKEPEHNKINGPIFNRVFEKLKFKTTYIVSHFDDKKQTISTELFHDGLRIYRIVERNTEFTAIPDTTVTLHYMNPYKKAYFKRQTGLHAVDFGAVFLFLNGYRVPPYGDRNNDWLQLDNRKTQGQARHLGNRELIGRIEVADGQGKLRVVSNREGVVRNATFTQLIDRDGAFYLCLKRLERFVVDGLNWDSVPESERFALEAGHLPGENGRSKVEVYKDSADKKLRTISLNLIKLIGASAANTLELEIDGQLVSTLAKERDEEVHGILEKFKDFSVAMGAGTSQALAQVAQEFEKKEKQLEEAKNKVIRKERQLERVIGTARIAVSTAKDLAVKVKTQESELLFTRLASGTDKETLMLLHHQNNIYANTTKNYLDRAIVAARAGELKKSLEAIEKAMLSTQRIVAVTAFATKANFRLKTDTITEDVAVFIKEYVENVAKNVSATNLILSVKNNSNNAFKMKFKPIDLAIVFDNLASNSTRVGARKLNIVMTQPADNELMITVRDDGNGLSKEISPPESIFNVGVTTTSGSGLGLFHVKQTIEKLGGQVVIDKDYKDGFGVVIRLFK
jgi:signal transduction histidine kinase